MNINDNVYVKLTNKGKDILQTFCRLNTSSGDPNYERFYIFGDYYEFQLWEIMQIFSKAHRMGMTQPLFVNNEILLERPQETIQEWADWKWYGNAGHLCVGNRCRFHLCTKVGNYLISTVGEYYETGKDTPTEIGLGRLYETMVFKFVEEKNGDPLWDGCELDFNRYNNRTEANQGHIEMCKKWSIL